MCVCVDLTYHTNRKTDNTHTTIVFIMKREKDPVISNLNKSGGHYVMSSETLQTQTVTHGLIHEYF